MEKFKVMKNNAIHLEVQLNNLPDIKDVSVINHLDLSIRDSVIAETWKPDAFKSILRLNELKRSFNIFKRNSIDIIKIIKFHNNPKNITNFTQIRNNYKAEEIISEIIKCLHNFLSSAFSLVDHSRRINKNIIKDGKVIPNYNEEIEKRFAKNKLHNFLKDLRNCYLHHGIIYTDSKIDLENTKTRIFISTKHILDYKKWSELSKEFINDNASIDLKECIENYYNQVFDFYNWYEIQYNEAYKIELQKAEMMYNQSKILWYNNILSKNINIGLSILKDDYSLELLENIFSGILYQDFWRELDKIPEDPKLRMDYILKILKDEKIGDEKMYQRIIQLFQKLIK